MYERLAAEKGPPLSTSDAVRVITELLTVPLAGISGSIGQSVVLFVNRVNPARFIFSLLIGGGLVAVGYGAAVLCMWATFLIPGSPHIGFIPLAVAVALGYAPLLLSLLAALPYAGNALLWGLRAWQLVATVLSVAAAARLSFWAAAGHVALGWTVMVLVQHAFHKPIAQLGLRIASAAAGKPIVREQAAVQRAIQQLLQRSTASQHRPGHSAHARRKSIPIFGGIIATFIFVTIIVIALTPLHRALVGPYVNAMLRVGLNLIWVLIVAVVIAAFLAPLETLGWWAGWYGDEVDAARKPPAEPAATRAKQPSRYVVYLDGISQSSSTYTPDIATFLDTLEAELPEGVRLIRGIMAYSVVNRPLDDDPIYAQFWKIVESLRGRTKTAILGMFINIRNVMIVAVSADSRYGPLYNLGIAQVAYDDLMKHGYRPNSAIPITMLGYSGGAQMCAETGPLLKRALRAPIEMISLGGVMTGTCPFMQLDQLYHLHGSKDIIEPLGSLMFSSRWKIARDSNWNRAMRRGKITIIHLGPVRHQVPGGMLDPNYMLPDGRSALRQTLDHINDILSPQATPPL